MLLIVYLILSFIIGVAGRRRRIGFFGYFLLSVLLTPVVALGWLLISHRRFLARETAAGHLVICADCANAEARETAIDRTRCARCGAAV